MSVQNFFRNKQPLVNHENYIGNTADLITLKAERDDAWLDRQILWLLVRANNRVLSVSPLDDNRLCCASADGILVSGVVDILEQSKWNTLKCTVYLLNHF